MIDDQAGAGDRLFWPDRETSHRVLLKKHTFVPINYPYEHGADDQDQDKSDLLPPPSLHGLRARAKQLSCRPIGICRTVHGDSGVPRIRISGTVCPIRRALYEEQMSMAIAQVAAEGDSANFSSVLAPLLGNVRDELLMQLDIHATLYYEAVKLGYKRWSRKPAAAATADNSSRPVVYEDRVATAEDEGEEMYMEPMSEEEEDKASCARMSYTRDSVSRSTAEAERDHGAAFMAHKIAYLEKRLECVQRRLADARRRLHHSLRHSFLKDRDGVSVADGEDDQDEDALTRQKPIKSAYIRSLEQWKSPSMQRPLATEEKCNFYRAVNRQMRMAVHGLTMERK